MGCTAVVLLEVSYTTPLSPPATFLLLVLSNPLINLPVFIGEGLATLCKISTSYPSRNKAKGKKQPVPAAQPVTGLPNPSQKGLKTEIRIRALALGQPFSQPGALPNH
uniref:Uncharacterized protein n=1 Tax=Oryza punctata TaxID=4537 RepID=A0A0E0KNJ0_ORYPU